MERIKEFIIENRFVFIVGILLLLLICWLHTDNHRNDGIHQDTDSTVADLEKRIESIEHRIDTVSQRIDQAEKTNTELGGRIESSTSIAKEIATGIDGLQDGLDSAIQRSGRIANLIADIESKKIKGASEDTPNYYFTTQPMPTPISRHQKRFCHICLRCTARSLFIFA